jgi:hypothetical protein
VTTFWSSEQLPPLSSAPPLDPDPLPPLEDGDAASPLARLELDPQPAEKPTATTNAISRRGDRFIVAVVAIVRGVSLKRSMRARGRRWRQRAPGHEGSA